MQLDVDESQPAKEKWFRQERQEDRWMDGRTNATKCILSSYFGKLLNLHGQ